MKSKDPYRFAANRPLRLEYRWRCGMHAGRWMKTHRAAGNAAVRKGLATWDGAHLFLRPLVEIEEREAQ
jgi:hypothetical protein